MAISTRVKNKGGRPAGSKGRFKWNNDWYVKVYKLALSGESDTNITKILNITNVRFQKLIDKNRSFFNAVKEGREDAKKNDVKDYVYKQLTPEAKATWDKIMKLRKLGAREDVKHIVAGVGKLVKMQLFLHALLRSGYDASAACRLINISHATLQNWKSDPDFGKLLEEIQWHKGNLVENALLKLVKKGDTSAVIFASRTLNRDRGFSERTEQVISGSIAHTHALDISQLSLPLQEAILDELRAKREALTESNGEKPPPKQIPYVEVKS